MSVYRSASHHHSNRENDHLESYSLENDLLARYRQKDEKLCVCKTIEYTNFCEDKTSSSESPYWSFAIDELDFSIGKNCTFSQSLEELKHHDDWNISTSSCDSPELETCFIKIPQVDFTDAYAIAVDHTKIPHRPIDPDPNSDRAWSVVQGWLEDCSNNHGHDLSSSPLPSRVLEIDAINTSVRVIETMGKCASYVALSHCWGKIKILTLTARSWPILIKGIPISDLPQTFKDAIAITQRLNIRYIWIDSLCILQDDLDDWEAEAANMANVYSHAYLTIAATQAFGDTEGFLEDRTNRPGNGIWFKGIDPYFKLIPIYNSKALTEMYFTNCLNVASCDEVLDNRVSHLLFRAWTLQESYLSTRTLNFHHNQMIFECPHHRQFEGGQSIEATVNTYTVNHLLPKAPAGQSATPSIPGVLPARKSYEEWYRMIYEYSTRRLTYPSDKLPALSGIASKIATSNRGGHSDGRDYLAGIWREDCFTGLLWYIRIPRAEPQPLRAPSWSWASSDGEIDFLGGIFAYERGAMS